jgi:hypothetical protein
MPTIPRRMWANAFLFIPIFIQLIAARVIPPGKPRKKVRVPIVLGVHNFMVGFGCESDGEISIDICYLLVNLPKTQRLNHLFIKPLIIAFGYSKSPITNPQLL